MQNSTRDQTNAYLTEYAELMKKYFETLSTVADHNSEETGYTPEQLIKQIIVTDNNLQKAVEHSKGILPTQKKKLTFFTW